MNTKTVTELAGLFGVTRQAMNKRVKSLASEYVEKNEKNITVVKQEGIHQLEQLMGKVVTAEAEVVDKPDLSQTTELSLKDDSGMLDLVRNLMRDKNSEIDQLHHQLTVKDQQLAEKDKQIQRQQEMMEKALGDQQQFFVELQEQMKTAGNRGFFARLFGK
ncbi:DUF536 domain-containing protein [Lactococcus termiticola]|uniref:Regulator of chromosome segregation-like C-terminal domain-containing protein n=1 Tax=Lactococcus termiticola TaxID=2169526 RepID=A0A2R5HJQ9_9LACT|nr:DUF536 domain-containing protein [Lactococcus termiticola]GBG96888.1 hypothetical protein NtB2_01023 [Lactococcus termiticola]